MSKKLIKKSQDKLNRYARRKHRTNITIKNTADPARPRLVINKSNAHMQAQVVDMSGKVLAFASSFKIKKWTWSEKAFAVGEEVAKVATKNGVTQVVFDRNGNLYHGRVKQLAEWARAGGLDF